jgi:hypothetical protein
MMPSKDIDDAVDDQTNAECRILNPAAEIIVAQGRRLAAVASNNPH